MGQPAITFPILFLAGALQPAASALQASVNDTL
jgi:hypothetical protein